MHKRRTKILELPPFLAKPSWSHDLLPKSYDNYDVMQNNLAQVSARQARNSAVSYAAVREETRS